MKIGFAKHFIGMLKRSEVFLCTDIFLLENNTQDIRDVRFLASNVINPEFHSEKSSCVTNSKLVYITQSLSTTVIVYENKI